MVYIASSVIERIIMKRLFLVLITFLLGDSCVVLGAEGYNELLSCKNKSTSEEIAAAQEIIENIISENVAYFTPKNSHFSDKEKTIWHNVLVKSFYDQEVWKEVHIGHERLLYYGRSCGWGQIAIDIEYYSNDRLIGIADFLDDDSGGYWQTDLM